MPVRLVQYALLNIVHGPTKPQTHKRWSSRLQQLVCSPVGIPFHLSVNRSDQLTSFFVRLQIELFEVCPAESTKQGGTVLVFCHVFRFSMRSSSTNETWTFLHGSDSGLCDFPFLSTPSFRNVRRPHILTLFCQQFSP